MSQIIIPDWPAAKTVRAAVSTRIGGNSAAPYSSWNMGDHVGDDATLVRENRSKLVCQLGLPSEPAWLQQTHSDILLAADSVTPGDEADASYTGKAGVVCAVMTADCLPVLLCDEEASLVMAIHAGWRGLQSQIINKSIAAVANSRKLMAWLGPAICGRCYELGDEVRQQFLPLGDEYSSFFVPSNRPGFYLADVYAIARHQLAQAGVNAIYGGKFCTLEQADQFYSYRRDGVTGRMASLIWLEKS